jgi:3-deoxy-manno-octulosonate cytidylyltransferase (CMP-KDO synthetase)
MGGYRRFPHLRTRQTGLAWDAILNIQGDEPFISPAQIDALAAAFADDRVEIATLIRRVACSEVTGPDAVKVVINRMSEAMYFSRSVIPFRQPDAPGACFLHVGIYGYRPHTLKALSALPAGELEATESLEQLRWLEHGYRIRTVLTADASHPVDTPADLEKLKSVFGL